MALAGARPRRWVLRSRDKIEVVAGGSRRRDGVIGARGGRVARAPQEGSSQEGFSMAACRGTRTNRVAQSVVQILPSILAADFARLGEQIKTVEAAGIETLHVDIMDG